MVKAAPAPDQRLDPTGFRSELDEPLLRLVAHVVVYGLETGVRTADDFIRHFPPQRIMMALADEPPLRARLLEATIGLRPRIGLRKSAESSGDDLQIALDEEVTDADAIVGLFEPDDRVRYLDVQDLWAYVTEPRFWLVPPEDPRFEAAKRNVEYMLDRGLQEGLLTHRDIVGGLTVPTLVDHLPRGALGKIIERALGDGREEASFTDEDLIDALGLGTIADHVPLVTIWDWVLRPKIAQTNGLVTETGDNEPLFDESEAHPDADDMTVLIDPTGAETEPSGIAQGAAKR